MSPQNRPIVCVGHSCTQSLRWSSWFRHEVLHPTSRTLISSARKKLWSGYVKQLDSLQCKGSTSHNDARPYVRDVLAPLPFSSDWLGEAPQQQSHKKMEQRSNVVNKPCARELFWISVVSSMPARKHST